MPREYLPHVPKMAAKLATDLRLLVDNIQDADPKSITLRVSGDRISLSGVDMNGKPLEAATFSTRQHQTFRSRARTAPVPHREAPKLGKMRTLPFYLRRYRTHLSRDAIHALANHLRPATRAAERFVRSLAVGRTGSWSGFIKDGRGDGALYIRSDGREVWVWRWVVPEIDRAQALAVGEKLDDEPIRRLTPTYGDFMDAVGRSLGKPLEFGCGQSAVQRLSRS